MIKQLQREYREHPERGPAIVAEIAGWRALNRLARVQGDEINVLLLRELHVQNALQLRTSSVIHG